VDRIAYFSVGYRGTGGWPMLCAIPLVQGMTQKQFAEEQRLVCFRKLKPDDKDEFAVFIAPVTCSVNLAAMVNSNSEVRSEVKEFYTYQSFKQYMGW